MQETTESTGLEAMTIHRLMVESRHKARGYVENEINAQTSNH